MPSETESRIAAQAIGGINEITPPYNPSNAEGLNSRFNYIRREQTPYEGKSAIDSVVSDIKYAREKAVAGYDSLNKLREDNRLYQRMIRNAVSAKPDMSLYNNLMFGYSRN